jgi:hypothetical protein
VPLLMVGLLSVIYWRFSGDLRPYILVQFYPLILIPVLLCFSKRDGVTSLAAQWGMIACYVLAKAAEMVDGRVAIPAGAHAWKHIVAAVGLLLYTQSISNHPAATLWGLQAADRLPKRGQTTFTGHPQASAINQSNTAAAFSATLRVKPNAPHRHWSQSVYTRKPDAGEGTVTNLYS